jgi:hypothetical protein
MKGSKNLIFAFIVALVLSFGGAAFAATASGDIVGLADYVTMHYPRPNTYTADLSGVGETYTLQIVRLIEVSNDIFVPIGFPTEEEAKAVTWSQNTPNMYNGYIDDATYQTVYSADISGYYLQVDAYNLVQSLGPDSWRATDGDGNTGDFSFVATDYSNADSGVVYNINIELYDGDPTVLSAFASGFFSTVNGNDDYDSITGDHGRSYATPLDSVAHGTISPDKIITTYHKYTQTQNIWEIEDLNGVWHTPSSDYEAFLYAVYYSDDGHNYTRDPISEIVGYDDYLLQRGALVIFAIGDIYDWKTYTSYFPDNITR